MIPQYRGNHSSYIMNPYYFSRHQCVLCFPLKVESVVACILKVFHDIIWMTNVQHLPYIFPYFKGLILIKCDSLFNKSNSLNNLFKNIPRSVTIDKWNVFFWQLFKMLTPMLLLCMGHMALGSKGHCHSNHSNRWRTPVLNAKGWRQKMKVKINLVSDSESKHLYWAVRLMF